MIMTSGTSLWGMCSSGTYRITGKGSNSIINGLCITEQQMFTKKVTDILFIQRWIIN